MGASIKDHFDKQPEGKVLLPVGADPPRHLIAPRQESFLTLGPINRAFFAQLRTILERTKTDPINNRTKSGGLGRNPYDKYRCQPIRHLPNAMIGRKEEA